MPRGPYQQEPLSQRFNGDIVISTIFLLVGGHSACFWPFMRKNFGVRAFYVHGLVALAMLIAFSASIPRPEPRLFLPVWLGLVIFHRGVSLHRQWKRIECHSNYDGEPWLANRLFGWPSELAAKSFCEPLLLAVIGSLLFYALSEPLGLFVGLGSVSLFVKKTIERGIENAEIQVMRDKEIEMRARMARYRDCL